ncbi:hypothetical protein HN911_13440 [Candidatus Bathyarchaeota archaeon]|jgi:hypothetical protein|nr:hypothetical protein [Candidatus Bathyarchaeota archaeon]
MALNIQEKKGQGTASLKKITVRVAGSSVSGVFDPQDANSKREIKELMEVVTGEMLGNNRYPSISVSVSNAPVPTPQDLFQRAVMRAERAEMLRDEKISERKLNKEENFDGR